MNKEYIPLSIVLNLMTKLKLTVITTEIILRYFACLFVCLNWCFTSQSTAVVMTGRGHHFMGLLPNTRMS